MYRVKSVIDSTFIESITNASLKECYKNGARLVRLGRRAGLRVRYHVYSLDGEHLLGFYARKTTSHRGWVARLTAICRYGRVCNGIDF